MKMTATTRKRRPAGLTEAMESLALDAVDREVCRKFRELVATDEIQIGSAIERDMVQKPETVDIDTLQAEIRPFFRHYAFMMRRAKIGQRS